MSHPERPGAPALRILMGIAAVIVIAAGLRAASDLLRPIALAVFLSLVLITPMRSLRARGVPSVVSLALVILMAVSALGAFAALATKAVDQIRLSVPRYIGRVGQLEEQVLATAYTWGLRLPDGILAGVLDTAKLMEMAGAGLRGFASAASGGFIVLLLASFMLVDMAEWPAKVREATGNQDVDLSRFARIGRDVQQYLAIKTVISIITGVLIGLWAWVVGIDLPLVWGLLAFALNYVPTIGSIVAAVPGIAFAVLQLGWESAVLMAIGYVSVNGLFGNIIEPQIQARGLSLSALSVLLSLFFWGYVWGPVGMFLSLPLTVIVKAALENFEGGRWVSVMLSPAPRGDPPAPAG